MPELPDLSLDYGESRSRVRRIALALGGLAMLGGAAYGAYALFFKDDKAVAPASEQQTAVVTKGQLVSSFTGTGTAQSSLSGRLTFPSSGQVTVVAGTFVLAPLLAASALGSGLLYAGSPLHGGWRALMDRGYVLVVALVAGGFAVVHVLVLVPWMTAG